jgi:hypothetical protein
MTSHLHIESSSSEIHVNVIYVAKMYKIHKLFQERATCFGDKQINDLALI